MADRRLRVGILGAARNVPFSVLGPKQANADLAARLDIVGLASLEQAEAEKYAKEWGIPKAYSSFEAMLADPQVDAVYNVLPTAVRCQWTVKAIQAGKHVLSETPMCMNALEAMVAQRAAEDHGKVLLEGTHPTCHPVTKRVREMILEGKIGALDHIDLDLPIGHSLQGKVVCAKAGALMSLGCHGVAIVRALAGEDPLVINASAHRLKEDPEVDEKMSCNLRFPSGAGAHISCSVSTAGVEQPTLFTISGSSGTIRVKEWFTGSTRGSNEIQLEQFEECGEHFVERVDNPPSRDTFYYQLMTFIDEVQDQERRQVVGLPWSYQKAKGPHDAVRNMALIDAIYRSANMKPKVTTAPPPAPYDRIGMSKL
mmetsp:Transcript_53619/g.136061  ORF Transcript_53619/g.136061 Transcript_53619/m.136061 type:complete len:369 (-) Transcript_53619:251-1357(-)|eukprot:CAMPEP_0183550406 /NCGR_PEP_ID=MMETSP0371-20130417/64520_1 /TAXON_ID=268820 /ORGANISM="Peridinium aciculiferum, Strain PAER-2" /LENGTH=368 /DNA_ID=CAMNT_0025754527 /DNA_START=74 /DNA_END=1180 /DNA_ORIENTATION=+